MQNLVNSLNALLAGKTVDTLNPLVADDVIDLLVNDNVPKLLKDVSLPMGGMIILFTSSIFPNVVFGIVWDKRVIDINLVINGEYHVILDCPKQEQHFWCDVLDEKVAKIVGNLF